MKKKRKILHENKEKRVRGYNKEQRQRIVSFIIIAAQNAALPHVSREGPLKLGSRTAQRGLLR